MTSLLDFSSVSLRLLRHLLRRFLVVFFIVFFIVGMMIAGPRPDLSLRRRLPPSALHVARARAAPVPATVICPLCFKRWFFQPHMLLHGKLRRELFRTNNIIHIFTNSYFKIIQVT